MANIFKRAWDEIIGEKRSASVSAETYSPELAHFLGLSYNSTKVTPETALKLSAVYRCVAAISEGIAKVPINVFERAGKSRQVASSHPVQFLLHDSPNDFMTSFAFKQAITAIALLRGNGYALINRGAGQRPKSLKLYPAGTVSLVESEGQLFAQTPDGLKPYYDIFHLRGLGFGTEGISPIRYGADSMGVSLSAQTFGSKFFENGAHLSGALKYPGQLNDVAFAATKKRWNDSNSGLANAGGTAILEHGMDYVRIGIPPEEAQFIQTREFGTTDVCRWFGVPPHKIFDLGKATFSNIEQQNIEFVQDGLTPWCERFEQEANKKLFRENEKGILYTKFNLNALLRGDTAARGEFYDRMFNIGVFSQNDIRELEDQNPIEGGERYYVQGNNMVPIDRIDDVLTAKMTAKPTKTDANEQE